VWGGGVVGVALGSLFTLKKGTRTYNF